MKNPLLLPTLIACLSLIAAGRATAQTFTTLHSFTVTNDVAGTNGDGASPYAGLITNSSGNTLYGTAWGGGQFGKGTVFALSTDGTGFTSVHDFTGGSDGASPYAGLLLSGSTLYGTASHGGSSGAGTVFSVHTGGTGFTVLRSFEPFRFTVRCTSSYDCSLGTRSVCGECHFFPGGWRCVLRPGNCPGDTYGGYPYAGLILSGDTLYGTARGDDFVAPGTVFVDPGTVFVDPGTVFAVNTNGDIFSFRQLYGFGSRRSGPKAGLILSGDTLYGTTPGGGSSGGGTVFAVRTSPLCSLCNGVDFTNLHSFTGDSDGAGPVAGLITNSSGTTLYGTAGSGGSFGNGTVFAVNTDGTGFTNLHSFAATSSNSSGNYTNSDGATPQAGLILSGNTLYGTAAGGGSSGKGTVFALNTDGTGFTNLHNFTACATNSSGVETNDDGANPYAGLILSGNTLYGTASAGGSSGNGTVFSLSFTPQLAISTSETNVILSWPTNVAGFDYTGYTLQEAANLGSPTDWIPSQAFPPEIVNGQVRLTTPMLGPQRFYRLGR